MVSLRPAGRAIVIKNGQILVMRRTKNDGRKYMALPGGRLETGESQSEAVLRELWEETMITVSDPRLVFIEEPNDGVWGTQYIYICKYEKGEPKLHPDSEELASNREGADLYEPVWFPVDNIPDTSYPFRSERLGVEILKGVKFGFPEVVKEWQLDPTVLK